MAEGELGIWYFNYWRVVMMKSNQICAKNRRPLCESGRACLLIVTVAIGTLTMSHVPPAQSTAVVCTNCSTIWNQMMEYAKAAETSLNTARQLQTQIRQYNDMLKQGASLPDSAFNSLASDLRLLEGVYQDSRALAHSMSNLDQQFRDQFKGYDDYLSSIGQGSNNMPDRYKKWATSGFDNARTAMAAVGMNVSMFEAEDSLLSSLVRRSATAQGRMQAIQAGNEIAAQQVQQLQKLREMVAANVTLQANYIAQETERRAVDDAFVETFQRGSVERVGSESF